MTVGTWIAFTVSTLVVVVVAAAFALWAHKVYKATHKG